MTIASVTARYCEHFAMGKRDFGAPKEFIQSVVMGARNKTSYFVDPSFVFRLAELLLLFVDYDYYDLFCFPFVYIFL